MNNSSSVGRLAIAVAACIAVMGSHRLHAQEAGLPEAVRIGLDRYAELDPLAVTYSQSIEVTPMGREKIPARDVDDIIALGAQTLQIAFREGRIYESRGGKYSSSGPSMTDQFAFDGNVLYSLGRGQLTLLTKQLPKNLGPKAPYEFGLNYLRAAGIRLPTFTRELVSSWRPQSELLAMLAEGGRVEAAESVNFEGRPLVRVQVAAKDWRLQGVKMDPTAFSNVELHIRSKPGITEQEVQKDLAWLRKWTEQPAPQRRYDFYFDPECGYAVRRLETRDDAGRLLTRSDCTEHQQLPDRHIWMPRRCQIEEYTYNTMTKLLHNRETLISDVPGSPFYVYHFQVSAFDVEAWPFDRFELNLTEPGGWIDDGTYPEVTGRSGIRYRIPADPQQLDDAIAAARAKYQQMEYAKKWSFSWKVFFLALNGVVLSLVVFYLIVRWRKKARAA
jgi:hypothetical protein